MKKIQLFSMMISFIALFSITNCSNDSNKNSTSTKDIYSDKILDPDKVDLPIDKKAIEKDKIIGIIDNSIPNINSNNNQYKSTKKVKKYSTIKITKPDIHIKNISALQSTVLPGQLLDIDIIFQNRGMYGAGSFSYKIYLTEDYSITANDIVLFTGKHYGLSKEASQTERFKIEIPQNFQEGTYTLAIEVDTNNDIQEFYEKNNETFSKSPIVITKDKPNIEVISLSTSQSSVERGSTLNVERIIANKGSGDSGKFTYSIYLTKNDTLDEYDFKIYSFTINGLQAGDENKATIPVVIPASIHDGLYNIGIKLDQYDEVPESDERNNVTLLDNKIQVSGGFSAADLYLEGINITRSTLQKDDSATAIIAYSNIGTLEANNFSCSIYISRDKYITTTDLKIKTAHLSAIAAKEHKTALITFTMPKLPNGNYYIGAILDPHKSITDINSSNNSLAHNKMITYSKYRPDLEIQSLSIPSLTVSRNQTVDISAEISNEGNGSSGYFSSAVYLSTDSTLSQSDIKLVSILTNGMYAGEIITNSHEVKIPKSIQTGTYYIGYIVDIDDEVIEISESNNSFLSREAISILSGIDLRVGYILYSGSLFVYPGYIIDIDSKLENIGFLNSGGFNYGIYLSVDENITIDDYLIYDNNIQNIAANYSKIITDRVKIPQTVPSGLYHIGIIVNDDKKVIENNYSNNSEFIIKKITIDK